MQTGLYIGKITYCIYFIYLEDLAGHTDPVDLARLRSCGATPGTASPKIGSCAAAPRAAEGEAWWSISNAHHTQACLQLKRDNVFFGLRVNDERHS